MTRFGAPPTAADHVRPTGPVAPPAQPVSLLDRAVAWSQVAMVGLVAVLVLLVWDDASPRNIPPRSVVPADQLLAHHAVAEACDSAVATVLCALP